MKTTLTHLMIAVYCFQFKNTKLSSFLEWCVLMEKYRPGFEVWKVYKYFPLVVCVTVLTANSNLRSLEFKVLLVLFLPFCVYDHRGLSFFFSKKFFLSIFFNCHHFSMVTIHYFDPWRWFCYFTKNYQNYQPLN